MKLYDIFANIKSAYPVVDTRPKVGFLRSYYIRMIDLPTNIYRGQVTSHKIGRILSSIHYVFYVHLVLF